MGRLFWKIFFAFWLTALAAAAVPGTAVWLQHHPRAAAYAELVFLPALWPDFGDAEFEAVLAEYFSRERRYGGVVDV